MGHKWARISIFPRLWRHNWPKSMISWKFVKSKQFGTPSGHLIQEFIFYRNSGYDVKNSPLTPWCPYFGGCLQGLIWSTTPRGQSVRVSKKYDDLQIFNEKRPLLPRLTLIRQQLEGLMEEKFFFRLKDNFGYLTNNSPEVFLSNTLNSFHHLTVHIVHSTRISCIQRIEVRLLQHIHSSWQDSTLICITIAIYFEIPLISG